MSQDFSQGPFVPPPPPQPSMGNPMYPPNVLEAKAKEASDDVRTAFIFAGIGLICFGFIFGFLAFRKANNALEIIDHYQVVTEKRGLASAAKIWGIADIVLWGVGLLARFYLRW